MGCYLIKLKRNFVSDNPKSDRLVTLDRNH